MITWFSMVGRLVARQGKAAEGVWPVLNILPTPQPRFPSFVLAALNKEERKLSVTSALPVSRIVPLTECLILIVLCDLKL